MTKEDYVPVEILETDKRRFALRYEGKNQFLELGFTQLDFLQIRSYLKGKNQRLVDRIEYFIKGIDKDSGLKTDFERKLPRRRINGKS